MIGRIAAVLVTVAGVGVGCATAEVKNGHFQDDKVEYSLGEPGEGWTPMRIETANAAWHSKELAASLMVNSHCAGVGDTPLEGLTSDLIMGMSDREVLSQEVHPWSKREAMETLATAKLDGVGRKLALFVLKKDGCVYDIVLDADPVHFDAARAAFNKVRDGFDVAARRDRE